MQKRVANFISYLFHPIIMPMMGLLLLLIIGDIPSFNLYVIEQKWSSIINILGLSSLFTFIIPTICIVILKKKDVISSYKMPIKEERHLPFLLTFISFVCFCFIMFKFMINTMPPFLVFIIFGATFGVFFAFMINTVWKISIHMIGMGGFTGMLLCSSLLYDSSFSWVYFALLISGMVGSSRMELKAHSISQVFVGYLVGLMTEVLVLFFL